MVCVDHLITFGLLKKKKKKIVYWFRILLSGIFFVESLLFITQESDRYKSPFKDLLRYVTLSIVRFCVLGSCSKLFIQRTVP